MKVDIKKFLILNFPYVFMTWFFGKIGQGFRVAPGADDLDRLMNAISGLGDLISRNPLPSFHPRDLLVGLIGAACVRMAVYIKAKNAKKYQHGVEYGSARCGARSERRCGVMTAAPAEASNTPSRRGRVANTANNRNGSAQLCRSVCCYVFASR